jgi:hypothetical protein
VIVLKNSNLEHFLDRDKFIKFFFNIASDWQENELDDYNNTPVFVALNGQGQSGKELIALAFDMASRPEKYPDGLINRNMKADDLLRGKCARQVHFVNARGQICETSQQVDQYLEDVASQAPQSKIHFISNLQHVFTRDNNDKTVLNSKLLDAAITVMKDDELASRESGLDANTLHKMLFGFRRTCSVSIRQTSPLAVALK